MILNAECPSCKIPSQFFSLFIDGTEVGDLVNVGGERLPAKEIKEHYGLFDNKYHDLGKFLGCQAIHHITWDKTFSNGKIVQQIKLKELTSPLPNKDMPDEIKADYEEARQILEDSPRGAVALLRLAVQKLMPHLGGKGKNINDDIAKLVEKGLSKTIQKALDALRVIGNEAVHPGQMDIKDDTDTASKLFRMMNIIVQTQISDQKEIADIYESLPESKREAIEKRDKNKN